MNKGDMFLFVMLFLSFIGLFLSGSLIGTGIYKSYMVRKSIEKIEIRSQYADRYSPINRVRREHYKPPLLWNEELYKSAQERVEALESGEIEWSHSGFDTHIWNYYEGVIVGENLARGMDSLEEAINAWLQSVEHRNLLLSEKFCDYGVGHSGTYYVLHVGCSYK